MKLSTINFISSLCFLTILAMSVFVYAFSSTTAAAENLLADMQSFSIYFVSTAKSQVESEACTLAKDHIAKNSAGFIWKNGNYFYVIDSAYENKNDAELVSLNLKNKNIQNEVFKIDFISISVDSPLSSKEANSTLNSSLGAFLSCYRSLFDISVSLDTNVYDQTQAMLEINRVNSQTDEIMKNYNLIFSQFDTPIFTSLSLSLSGLNETASELANYDSSEKCESLLSRIRYSYSKILRIYYDFLDNI